VAHSAAGQRIDALRNAFAQIRAIDKDPRCISETLIFEESSPFAGEPAKPPRLFFNKSLVRSFSSKNLIIGLGMIRHEPLQCLPA
jgi:hypothetical protein